MERSMKSKLPPAGPKMERKYVEKNRRNYMKNLYNQLHSLLPASKETIMTVPDQIDAAVNYIETLKMNLEKNKKHLEKLKMDLKRAQSLNSTNEPGPSTKSPPQIEFHEMGPNMVMVLINGLINIATFNNIIRLCYVEGVEVVSTRFELNGNSTLQISHQTKINRSSTMEFIGTNLCDKMKELIYGPSHGNDVESQLHLWDYKIEFDTLEYYFLPTTSQNPNMYSYMQN
ncbi:transcription factor bHLH162-like [Solanum stenotomum]|uniref:transcription factor bHLH162-like n=1 Tax=Solanum stenotomum TaxID=172797 RepID=UPI0020CFFA8F|nr:transcription factor bHLH162-like [Solanum stenotomum]